MADVLAPDEGVGDGDEVPRLATPPTLLCEGVVAVDRVRAVYPHVCRTVWGGVGRGLDGDTTTDVRPRCWDHYCGRAEEGTAR